MHPNSTKLWGDGLSDLHTQTKFDGVWLDLNELTAHVPGEINATEPE